MTYRVRLLLAFVFVALVPLAITVGYVSTREPGIRSQLVGERLQTGADAAAALLAQRCEAARAASQTLGWSAAAQDADAAVAQATRNGPSTYAAIVRDAALLAEGGELPAPLVAALGDRSIVTVGSCEMPNTTPHAAIGRSPLQDEDGRRVGTAIALLPYDRAFVAQLAVAADADVTLVDGDTVVASTLPSSDAERLVAEARAAVRGHSVVEVGDRLVAGAPAAVGRPVTLLLSADAPVHGISLPLLLLPVFLLFAALAAVTARQLARVVTKPLTDLSDAAGRVAQGDLDTVIEVRSRDEVGRVAGAFNDMTAQLRRHIHALETSRDELQRNLARLGETLSSTHDLNRILTVILETAMASVRAEAGSVLFASTGRRELYPKVTRGFEQRDLTEQRVSYGEGVAGSVAASGEARWGPVGAGPDGLRRADGEPPARDVISVPFKSSGRVLGVLNLYDRIDGRPFDANDVTTIRTFAAQATAAIDNVLLHQEAQRLSITDGLTGLWNYRYLQMNLGKEIERATRFGRPLSLLVLDLDHFKDVNDVHGHQRGDSVLIELAQRVKSEIREVDTLARYGGEEFVLVLPETDAEGARHIAQRINEVVRHRPFGGDGEDPLQITVSVGVAVFPDHATSAATLIGRADEALYAAKHAGRDTWRIATTAVDLAGAEAPVQRPHS